MNKAFYIIVALLLFLTGSCKKDSVAPEADEMVDVGFTFHTPTNGQYPVKTYAITSNGESHIYQIILLAFKVVGSTETLDYYKHGMQIYAGATPNEKNFYTRLKKSADKYKFVLIINGGDDMDTIVDGIVQGTEKEDVMEQLVMPITQKWNTDPVTFTPLPMWGESGEVVGINYATVIPDVDILRSVARLDITLSNSALTDFTIESVHIYGMRDKLLMAPLPANLDMSNKPTAPSIAAGTAGLAGSQDYTYSSATSVIRDIYLPEANAGDTYVVIGGQMASDPGNTYYYRADIENTGGMNIPVLRNTKYVINITEVLNTGAVTPSTASAGISPNQKKYLISTITQTWDDK